MERATIKQAEILFGRNFIGSQQLKLLFERIGINDNIKKIEIPEITYSYQELSDKKQDYILVLGIPKWGNITLSIESFKFFFGTDPDKNEPCFYNQDWYIQEDFIKSTLELRWYLIKKEAIDRSRAIQPDELLKLNYQFPSAILCTYTFFAYYYSNKEYLWFHDFIWCNDKDHNGDRIYIGRYNDIDGINKNGFSIHRHLSLRNCYASSNMIL